MQMAIINAVLVMENHYIFDANILVENGTIKDFGVNCLIPSDAQVVDAKGLLVGPGLIDIHTHAGGGSFFQHNPQESCRALLKHGVTGLLPALYMNLSPSAYIDAVDKIEQARSLGKCDNVIGYYMEGPYLNPDYGCERHNYPWDGDIVQEQYIDLLKKVGTQAKVWAVAPEREGIEQFVKDVKSYNPDVVFAVAHSVATPEQIEALMPYGLCLGTHHTNATGTINKYPECRTSCVDETVNFYDSIYAELICDSLGVHVDPFMLRLVRKIKGEERIILISDAFVANGPVPKGFENINDLNFDHAGEIAGSKITLDIACQNMMKHTGCSPLDTFRYASTNPARLLKLTDRGKIAKGARADLVVVDSWMNIKHVILKGELIK